MVDVSRRRFLDQFTDRVGGNAFTFPPYEREWTSQQPYSVPVTAAVGADYGFDHLGLGLPPRRVAVENVRFLLLHRQDVPPTHEHAQPLEIQIDRMLSSLYSNGSGQLWIHIDSQEHIDFHPAQRRWATARITRAPDISYGGRSRQFVPVGLEFVRLSDWFAESETTVTQPVSASPTQFEVVNAGNTLARDVVIELRSNGTNGYVDPTMTNLTTSESFQVLRTGSNSNHRQRISTAAWRAERSTDGGSTWTNDYATLVVGATQSRILTLAPGSNLIEVSQPSGTPNMTAVVRFHAPYL